MNLIRIAGNEVFEKMKDVLIDARAAVERLVKELLKISSKLEQNDSKSHVEVSLVLSLNKTHCFIIGKMCCFCKSAKVLFEICLRLF